MLKLQLTEESGRVARFAAGGAAELDFIESIVAKVAPKLNLLSTKPAVEVAVRAAIDETIKELKAVSHKAF